MTAWFSLRRRLLLPLLGGVSAAWIATSVWVFADVRHELRELVDEWPRHGRGHEHHDHKERDELIEEVAWRLVAPLLPGLPLLGAWIWVATRRGLAPLEAAAGEIAARDPSRLEPLAPATAPEEVRPLIEAINQLFARVGQAMEAERSFTADAAHELRTPLAALTTQAQVALRARDEAERNHAIEQLAASARRATRLVDQLLTLARLDPDAAPPMAALRLDALAEEVCAAHGAAALAADVALELDAAPATAAGDADWLRILLRNLIDNAIRYTPAGGRVTVETAQSTGGTEGARLVVADTGPGIPAEERSRVFARFHRLAGQDTEGSGLGLSIVARIAERHGATVALDAGPEGRGLRVAIAFPAVSGSATGCSRDSASVRR